MNERADTLYPLETSKRWPFTCTPGQLADRLDESYRFFGTMLQAVRAVFIEGGSVGYVPVATPREPDAWRGDYTSATGRVGGSYLHEKREQVMAYGRTVFGDDCVVRVTPLYANEPLAPCTPREIVERLGVQYGSRQAAALRGDQRGVENATHWLRLIADNHWHAILADLRSFHASMEAEPDCNCGSINGVHSGDCAINQTDPFARKGASET